MPEPKSYTLKELQELRDIILKHDTTGSPAGTQVAHGPSYAGLPSAGLFTRPGSRPDMFGTNVMPAGLMDVLPLRTTLITNPEYDILTGFTGARGSNAADFCSPAAKAGFAKICTQVARFGEMFMQTDAVVINKTGGRLNFADTDKNLLNPQALPSYLPDLLRRTRNINSQDWFQLYGLAVQMVRALETVVFTGNHALTPANAELGFIKEFDGLDLLIKTGHVDAATDTACAAVDSIVVDWGGADISETVDGDTMVQTLANVLYNLFQLAIDSNMGNVQFALLMYPDMFYALTRIWPCLDLLAGCDTLLANLGNGSTLSNISADQQRRMQDEMFMGRYLPVDGKRIPVITSQGIPLTDSGNGFSAPFYLVPLTVMGGYETLYVEGFNQGNAEASAMANLTGSNANYATFNGGFWAAATAQKMMCMEYGFAAQPRLILETPWLAARFDDVKFKLNHYSRQFRPSDPYYKNGGVTIRYSEQLYS